MSELTKRQWKLYNYLKERDGWTTQFEISRALYEYYTYNVKPIFHDTSTRHDITNDIRAINASGVIQKIILSSSKGIKLASEDEAKRYIKARYAAIFRQLERVRKIERKAGLDGQMRLVFGGEREVIQAFTDSNVTGERLKRARLAAGLKQNDVVERMRAEDLHVDAPMLSKFENGVCIPTPSQLEALARIYGVKHEGVS